MLFKRTLIISLILLVIAGCSDYLIICSLHPFYLEKNVVVVPEVAGSWIARPVYPVKPDKNEKDNVWSGADTLNAWTIERTVTKSTQKTKTGKDTVIVTLMNYYEAKLFITKSDTLQYSYKMVLFRVKDILFADFTPRENSAFQSSRLAKENSFPVHTLARVRLNGNSMIISWLGAEYMKEMIEKKRVRVSYKWVESAKRLILTGSPEQLTGMIERYAGEERFIDWNNQKAILSLNRIVH